MVQNQTDVTPEELYDHTPVEVNRFNKLNLFNALTSNNITKIEVYFNGEGDEGQIEDLKVYCGATKAELPTDLVAMLETQYNDELVKCRKPLVEAIETLCFGYLEEHFVEWEINDGSFGQFVFDVSAGTIALEHNTRVMDVTTEYMEF